MLTHLRTLILLLLIGFSAKSQSPTGFPTVNSPVAYYNIGWLRSDSGSIIATNTPTFTPRFYGTEITYVNPGVDTSLWIWVGRWVKELKTGDIPNLTATLPIVYSGGNISCPTCGTGGGGISSLNGLTATTQTFGTGTTGTDFNIVSSGSNHNFNFPTASASNRGLLGTSDWSTFNSKQPQLNGTGFVKATGTTITFDNSTYYLASNPNNYIGLGSLSALSPATYNNGTGAIGVDTGTGLTKLATQAYVLAHQASGTLTGAGNLSPLFTTSVVSNTLVFTLSNAAGNSIFGNNSGSPAAPSYFVPNNATLNTWNGTPLLNNALTSGNIYVGNASNVATGQTMTGDGGMTNTGNFTLSSIISSGTCAVCNVTLDVKGRTTAYTSGLGVANTWGPLQTFGTITTTGTTIFSGLTSSGANDSVLTVDPSTGQVHRRSGTSTIGAVSGLSVYGTTNDSFALGNNPLLQNTTIPTSGFTFSITGLTNATPGSTDSLVFKHSSGQLFVSPGLSLTTTGTSGASTYTPGTGVLNIPQYSGGGGGSAAGSIGNTQFKSSGGGFQADGAHYTYDSSTHKLNVDSINISKDVIKIDTLHNAYEYGKFIDGTYFVSHMEDQSFINPSGFRDNIQGWGMYNLINNGNRINNHFPGGGNFRESWFDAAGSSQMEEYTSMIDTFGLIHRPFFMNINSFNGNAYAAYHVNHMDWFHTNYAANPYFSITDGGNITVAGNLPSFAMNDTSGLASFLISTVNDGSINISGASGANPHYYFSKGIVIQSTNPSAIGGTLSVGSASFASTNDLEVRSPTNPYTSVGITASSNSGYPYIQFFTPSGSIGQSVGSGSSAGLGPSGSMFENSSFSNAALLGNYNMGSTFSTGTIGLYTGGSGAANLRMKVLANGNVLIGTTTDNAGFLQTAANTTTNASMFLNGAAADVTSPTNGMLWYNSTAHTLNFRDNGSTTNLLGFSSGTYTPTLTNTTNITSSTLTQATYLKIGNTVQVTITGSLTVTTPASLVTLTVSLPFTTATTTQNYTVSGSAGINGSTSFSSAQGSVNSGTTATWNYIAVSATSDNFTINIQYKL